MGIAARSTRWAKLALYSVRKSEDPLVKSNRICLRINAPLNSSLKEL